MAINLSRSYSSGLTDSILSITEFTGIDQSRGNHNSNYGSSPDAVNWISRYGKLYTAPGVTQHGSAAPESAHESSNGRLFQAYYRDASGNDSYRILMALHGRFYVSDTTCQTWTPIAADFTSNDWHAVNYRDEENEWIILANGVDQARYWDGTSTAALPLNAVQGATSVDNGDGTATTTPGEQLTFSQLTLLYERLWGAVTAQYPDRIYWSDTFDPENWEFDTTGDGTNGGGFLDVATFDGTRIRAVVAAFDDVLIFKDKSLHRLNGTYPGEFALTQVYGSEGTIAPRTIVHNGKLLYFLSSDGLCAYDGTSVTNLSTSGDRRLKDVWPRIAPSSLHLCCAVLKDNIIHLAVPLDGSATNTHVIEYDTVSGVYSLIALAGVDDWLLLREGQKETLLFLNADKVYRYGSGYTFYGSDINCSWISPEITLGNLASRKQTGRVYIKVSAVVRDVNAATTSLKLSMISGSKTRSKVIALTPGVNELRKRVKIRGRSFRFKIENQGGDPLEIYNGLTILLEEDFD